MLLDGHVEWMSAADFNAEAQKLPGRLWCNPGSRLGELRGWREGERERWRDMEETESIEYNHFVTCEIGAHDHNQG